MLGSARQLVFRRTVISGYEFEVPFGFRDQVSSITYEDVRERNQTFLKIYTSNKRDLTLSNSTLWLQGPFSERGFFANISGMSLTLKSCTLYRESTGMEVDIKFKILSEMIYYTNPSRITLDVSDTLA